MQEKQARRERVLQLVTRPRTFEQLVAGVAHDINNVLASIGLGSEMVLKTIGLDHPSSDDIQEIIKANTYVANLSRQLLDISSGRPAELTNINLNSVIEEMTQVLHRVLGGDITLNVDTADDLGLVNADTGMLKRVLVNLLANARDAMPDGGEVTIATMNTHLDETRVSEHRGFVLGEYIRLSVIDTGLGMDRKQLNRALTPFVTTKEPGKGMGLGLGIVSSIVKQSGGHFTIESELNKGSRIDIYLPRVVET